MFSDNTSQPLHSVKARPPAVAGQFYPDDPDKLSDLLKQMINRAKAVMPQHIKALIAPHAGLIYSGPIAATAYKSIMNQADDINRVVLLGPSHRVGFQGIATISASRYEMPMGSIEIDQAAFKLIEMLPQVQQIDKAHEQEHSLEVQLPFLQMILGSFTLIPLVIGDCSADEVAEVLEILWGDQHTLIVISSDLSHYQSYQNAQRQDQQTSAAILNLSPQKIGYDDACGRNPVNGLLVAARNHHLKPSMIDLRNSGDTAGSHDRVVGYGAYIFTD